MKSESEIDIKTVLDSRPLSRFQIRVVLLGLLVLMLDGLDTTSVGFIAPALVEDWKIAPGELSPVFMSGLFGLAIGALTAGPIGDRVGRKTVVVSSVFLFGFFSLASAFSTDLWTLALLRFLTGLGLGASMPNTATLVAEFAPAKHRNLLITFVYSGFAIGGGIGGVVSNYLIEVSGWRAVLVAGGVLPIAFGIVMLFALPESIRFLATRPDKKSMVKNIMRKIAPDVVREGVTFVSDDIRNSDKGKVAIIVGRQYVVGTLCLWSGVFATLFTLYLINSWLPLMIKDSGMSLRDASLVATFGQVGGALGSLAVGWFMDRNSPHKVLAATHLAAGLCALAICATERTFVTTSVLVALMGYCMNSLNVGYVALAARFYPTSVRATGTSWEQGIGRFGAITGAAIGGVLLSTGWSFNAVFAALCVPMALGMIAISIKSLFAAGHAHLPIDNAAAGFVGE
ncbi:aromatic acid/H+ symport family MFS transporter [Cupriavidus gilardii]|uniref:Aromatic acid/H+ symport family MFS transporter n=1 Tax=Cupriavidus gilardii TaxID=82541 RepID=A0A849B939_9BURK|nr:aromatic acid/H+ symport family MFS transporter [Cupriavidus gilardii]ALD91969.1 MFS transporter, AAHS family, 4-hydroxybenzoate transporter [Cupriavidus gilardii CR3]KAB0596103.1 aromatic acid/H+ symport family MFS transporter [Cupriavidus gilardii]MCT9014016.1 aromatic acid/H+ symport family MFS transporter [Cupriavidus gilardii]MCT9052204.1 aromatic acid/H+ symport family MFS transporter [Cupriavidus gilardii]MCT9117151.1 aromatic acid/H+ symport family MFS transporter [Cupriavidus gilar